MDEKYPKALTARRFKLAIELKRKHGIIGDIGKEFDVKPNTISKWHQEKGTGIPRTRLRAVAKFFHVDPWVFTDENLIDDDFIEIISDPALIDKFRKAKEVAASIPEIEAPTSAVGASMPKVDIPLPAADAPSPEIKTSIAEVKPSSVQSVMKIEPNPNSRMVGTVIEWDNESGVGSIMPERGYDLLYVSRSNLINTGNNAHRSLDVGESVAFTISAKKKDDATRVLRIPSLYRFAVLDNIDYLIKELAEKKILPGECWNYKHRKKGYPVLLRYIYDVFSRLEQEDSEQTDEKQKKIRIRPRSKKTRSYAIFDTGLVNEMYLRLYAVFKERNKFQDEKGTGKPNWRLIGFCAPGEKLNGIEYTRYFNVLPEPAEYFKDPGELVYDSKLPLHFSLKSISSEELRRWPKSIREKMPPHIVNDPLQRTRWLNSILQPNIEWALKRIHWDYKTAVPRYSFHSKSIQLLLPLCFEDLRRVDCVLAVQKENEAYVYATILSLDRAYGHARIIAPPHSDWLDPRKFLADSEEFEICDD